MKATEIKDTNRTLWLRDAEGRLKSCRTCGQPIYIKLDYDGIWRPYESWLAGNVDPGEWRLHCCE